MTTLDEAKGTVDKTSGHGKKDPASPFSVGQRVAHYKGMGKTIHGNVVTPHAVSGGTKGAMVKFAHGTEFVPHKDLKDAGQYWKDETDAMYKKRGVNEADELSLRPGATRLKSDMQTRVNKDGTLSDNERRAQKKLKTLMRMTYCTSGLTGPRCKLPEETELSEKIEVVDDESVTNVRVDGKHIGNIMKTFSNKTHPFKAYSKHWDMKQNHKTKKDAVDWLVNTHNTALKEDVELEEGSSGTIIHKVTHEGKVKFITKYGKAAEAVAKKIEANTGKACKITQHISDKNGFYRLHKEEVDHIEESVGYAVKLPDGSLAKSSVGTPWWHSSEEAAHKKNQASHGGEGEVVKVSLKKDSHSYNGRNVHEEADWEAEEREEKRKKLAGAMAEVDHLSKNMRLPTGRNYPAWLKRKQDAAKKVRETQGK